MEQYNKQSVILLGDGFFARGFLHNINYNKFSVTQFYRDPFINPQDLMYSLQRNKKYESSFHLILTSLTFLYGLPAGSLLYYDFKKRS